MLVDRRATPTAAGESRRLFGECVRDYVLDVIALEQGRASEEEGGKGPRVRGRGSFRFTFDFWLLIGAYVLLQILDGYLLAPLLFSDAVKLHPVIIMLAVFVFGGLFGFWGIFFAIPIATLIKAIWNSWPK